MKIFWKLILQILRVFEPVLSVVVFLSNKVLKFIGIFCVFVSIVLMYKFGIKNPELWIILVSGVVASIIAQNVPVLKIGYEELLGKIEILAYGIDR